MTKIRSEKNELKLGRRHRLRMTRRDPEVTCVKFRESEDKLRRADCLKFQPCQAMTNLKDEQGR
jgi:hypothetical protein